ncbi:MAG: CxxC-x17-CxxC domain-containing protein, partial [Patescibacteria group bacterium]
MGNFNGGGGFRGGNKGGFGGGRDSGERGGFQKGGWGGDKREVTMHSATCGDCGSTCEVPFRPTEGKPVYCKYCFAKRGG